MAAEGNGRPANETTKETDDGDSSVKRLETEIERLRQVNADLKQQIRNSSRANQTWVFLLPFLPCLISSSFGSICREKERVSELELRCEELEFECKKLRAKMKKGESKIQRLQDALEDAQQQIAVNAEVEECENCGRYHDESDTCEWWDQHCMLFPMVHDVSKFKSRPRRAIGLLMVFFKRMASQALGKLKPVKETNMGTNIHGLLYTISCSRSEISQSVTLSSLRFFLSTSMISLTSRSLRLELQP